MSSWAASLMAAPANNSFQHTSHLWQTDDGLPHNAVQAIMQTRDGYLWVGTRTGLARFDGVNFSATPVANIPSNTSFSVTALCETRDGSLWIDTEETGLFRWRQGNCV